MRWKIETFYKILKSGCMEEESRLRTADRFANLVSIFCILSWRVFWITMINRWMPEALPEMALTQAEIELLNHFVNDNNRSMLTFFLGRSLTRQISFETIARKVNGSLCLVDVVRSDF